MGGSQGSTGVSSEGMVLFPESGGTKEFAVEKETKAPEGAATGAGTRGDVVGALGWLVGIGTLGIPGLGPFIAEGPIGGNDAVKTGACLGRNPGAHSS